MNWENNIMKSELSNPNKDFVKKMQVAQQSLAKLEQEIAPFVKKSMVLDRTTAGRWCETSSYLYE